MGSKANAHKFVPQASKFGGFFEEIWPETYETVERSVVF
jgi:hypothetical protein